MTLHSLNVLQGGRLVIVTGTSWFGREYRQEVGKFVGVEDGLALVKFQRNATLPAFEPECVKVLGNGVAERMGV